MKIETKLKKLRSESKPSEETDEGRRKALIKLGIYGAYTAPALVALLESGKAAKASGRGGDQGGDDQGQNQQ